MVTFGAVAFGPTAMGKLKDEVKSWEKEKGLVNAKNFNELKDRVVKVLQGSKSDIKKDHEGTGMLSESTISEESLNECMFTFDEVHHLFSVTENQKGLDLLESLNEVSSSPYYSRPKSKTEKAVETTYKVLSTFGWLGGWLIGAKIATLMGWAASFWSAVFVKGIIAQAVVHGGVGNALKTTGTMVAGGMAGAITLTVALAALASAIVAGQKILDKIRKNKGK